MAKTAGTGSGSDSPNREISMTEILELIDWKTLPPETSSIASMLADGFTQRQIATETGLSTEEVSKRVRRLTEALLEQALARVDELLPPLRARVRELQRSLTAQAAANGASRSHRTG